jgi:hypothetical protein
MSFGGVPMLEKDHVHPENTQIQASKLPTVNHALLYRPLGCIDHVTANQLQGSEMHLGT